MFGAVGSVVVDCRSIGERDRFRKVDLVPGDGSDPPVGVGDQRAVGVISVLACLGCPDDRVSAVPPPPPNGSSNKSPG